MQKKFIIFVSLLLLIIIPMNFAADNETVSSDGAADSLAVSISNVDVLKASNDYYFNASAIVDGDGSQDNPFKYLKAERIKANSNIYLADGEYELDTSKNIEKVNIYGSNVDKTVICYSGVGFTVSSYLNIQNVTFSDMSITNYGNMSANNTVFSYGSGSNYDNYGNNFGGAIYSHQDYSNTHVTVNNCTFIHNFAIYGGAIYMGNGYLEVIDSIFDLNMAYDYGGAIACENTKKVSISKSKFYNSQAMGDAGGAIYVKSTEFSGKNIVIVNSSATFGSAITSLKSSVSLSGIECENNTAKWDGGAIYHIYGNFSLSGSKFTNNSARNGGALFIDNSTSCYVISNNFNNNNASHTGGAVYSILNILKNPFQIKNNFNNNHAYYMDNIFDTSEINLTIGNGNYTMYKVNLSEITELPSNFSLVDGGYTTVVKDQQTGGNCWAFTAMAVLESCILKANGDALDLSEENMKNLMAIYSDYGWNIDVNSGGYDSMPWGYLTSWLGPVLENDDLTDDKSALSPILNSIFHVQNILFLKRDNFTDNDAIKKALMQYGAVGTGIAFYNSYLSSNNYYCYSSMPCNHAVTIVGWDDNYSKSNFKWSSTIGDGAWLVRNSWGPNWGNNGYFYVSYYDMNFAKPGDSEASYTIIFNDTLKYDKNYQYDIPGKSDYFVNSSSSVWYKNIFTATEDEYLAAVSTYFEKITEWSVSIYINGCLELFKEGKSNPGYYTIDLDQLFALKSGDIFEVVFNVNVDGEASFPISESVSFNKQLYKPEISFVSYDGETWKDLYDLAWSYSTHTYKSQVACIKAFTVLNEVNTNLIVDVNFNGSNPANITAVVYNQYGNPLNAGEVKFNVNEEDYTANIVNGIAKLPYYFTNVQNIIFAKFSGVGYISSMNYTNFEIEKSKLIFDFNINQTLNNVTLNILAHDKINSDASVLINEKEYSINFTDGKSSLNLYNLENGIYNVSLSITFPSDSIYISDTQNRSFLIDMKNSKITSSDLIITDEDDINYTVWLFDELDNPLFNKTVELIIGDNCYNEVTDSNGKVTVPIKLNSGLYQAEIRFKGDNHYFDSVNYPNIKVKSQVIIGIDIERCLNNVNITFNVSKHVNDTLTVVINNKTEFVKVNDGAALLELFNLNNDIYHVTAALNESDFVFEKTEVDFTVDVRNTQIIANNVSITDEDMLNYTVLLVDEFNNALSNKSVEIILAGNTYNTVTDDNGEAVISLRLKSGVYTSNISFNGDNDYLKSESASNIEVKSKVSIELDIDCYANEAVFTVTLSKKSTGFLELNINNESKSLKFVNGYVKYKMSDLVNGYYTVSVSLDDSIYAFNEVSSDFTVDVRNTQILADDLVIDDEDLVDYSVCLTDEDGNALLNKSLDVDLNGTKYNLKTDDEGKINIPINLNPGVYNVNAAFKGDEKYLKSVNSSTITVKIKVEMQMSIEKYANNVTLHVNASKPINDTLTFVINNESKKIAITDGTINLDLTNLSNDIYDICCYLDEDIYSFNDVKSQFTVDVKQTEIVAYDLTIVEGDSVKFNITLTDEDGNPVVNRTVEFMLNGNNYTEVSDDNGQASLLFSLNNGIYDIYTIFNGDDNYFKSDLLNKIKVKMIVDISLDYNNVGDNYIIQLNSSNPMNETMIVKVNNISYPVKITNNTNELVLNNLLNGVYNVSISLRDNEDYYFENITSHFEIDTKYCEIISSDLVAYYNCKTTYSARLVDENSNPLSDRHILFSLNGIKTEVITDKDGQASFDFKLPAGGYLLFINYSGDFYEYYSAFNSHFITVKNTINASDSLIKTYNSTYMVNFLDNTGNPLSNADIIVILDNLTYTKCSDSHGNAYIDILQKPGNHTLTLINPINNETLNKTVSVVERIGQNKNLVMYEYGGNYYNVLVFDDNGNVAEAGVKVEMKIKNKIYTVKTKSNGYVSLKINLKYGKYTIITTYKGYNVSNKITVKKVLITKNISVKKGKKISFSAKLLNKKGKILKGKKITFKIKGKKYTAKTNKKGIAKITIKLKLKAGSYKIYTSYGKSQVKNTIKIKK